MLKNFGEIRKQAGSFGKKSIVVPAAEDEISIETALDAHNLGMAESILLGDKDKICPGIRAKCGNPFDFEIIHCRDYAECAHLAVKLVHEKRADMILKGHLDTGTLIKAVLDKEHGLRAKPLLSDVLILEDPLWDNRGGKLLGITDGGITPLPTLEQKKQILENAVDVFRRLGCECPKVAVMSATEKVSDKIQSTVDAHKLVEMNRRGEIPGCVVEGPMALDVVAHGWCARVKEIESDIAGEADILLMPSFEAGNILAKAFIFYMNRQIGHTIVGARVPIIINSRTDSAVLKLNSVALSALVG